MVKTSSVGTTGDKGYMYLVGSEARGTAIVYAPVKNGLKP